MVSHIFLCSPLLGEMIQFDEHIFQMDWNHPTRFFDSAKSKWISHLTGYHLVMRCGRTWEGFLDFYRPPASRWFSIWHTVTPKGCGLKGGTTRVQSISQNSHLLFDYIPFCLMTKCISTKSPKNAFEVQPGLQLILVSINILPYYGQYFNT